jgi:hypothetical protein
MKGRRALFVYAVCGDDHVRLVNTSLRFLKRFTRQDIVVAVSRCSVDVEHDQILRVGMPDSWTDHQTSILMKINLYRLLGQPPRRCCYLDSDVIAVNPTVDTIFRHKRGPVAFAADHVRLRRFSRWAVNCYCESGSCDHLQEAIENKFGVALSEPDWQHWNGGVYLFDSESIEFTDTWDRYTRSAFEDPRWKTRDQGTLVATVWKLGLQNQAVLPGTYNFIVDAMWGVPENLRASLDPTQYHVDMRYSLNAGPGFLRPHFLHLINGSPNARGWQNWDDAEKCLQS